MRRPRRPWGILVAWSVILSVACFAAAAGKPGKGAKQWRPADHDVRVWMRKCQDAYAKITGYECTMRKRQRVKTHLSIRDVHIPTCLI